MENRGRGGGVSVSGKLLDKVFEIELVQNSGDSMGDSHLVHSSDG